MSTLSEILKSPFEDQGIQNLDVFYDSFIFNLKVKRGALYENMVLIEKLSFDYQEEIIKRDKNALVINFGDSGLAAPLMSIGNSFLGAFLDKRRKLVFLVGIRRMQSGNIIPVVYRYEINTHTTQPVFPGTDDIAEFNTMQDPGVFFSDKLPRVSFKNSKIVIIYQKYVDLVGYIHRITLDVRGNTAKLEEYKVYRYDRTHNLNVLELDDERMVFQYDQYYGVSVPTGEDDLINLGEVITSLSVDPVAKAVQKPDPVIDDLAWLRDLSLI